jgi:phenylalanyl-tRNA synthetase alpha chain
VDISSLIDSLHPLEIKVLTAFGAKPSGLVLDTDQLSKATNLEASQLSMAIEWLLAKSLLAVDKETVTPVVSLTAVGERYHGSQAPIEEVLAAAKSAAGTGGRLTIQDLQSQDGLDPSDVSKAVGRLKKEGALLIVQGGCIESTGRPSPTADRLRSLLQQVQLWS